MKLPRKLKQPKKIGIQFSNEIIKKAQTAQENWDSIFCSNIGDSPNYTQQAPCFNSQVFLTSSRFHSNPPGNGL